MAKTQRAADGVNEKAEDRSAEIAEKIGECAREMKVRACDLTWHDFRAYGAIAWGDNRLGIVRRDITRLGGFNAIRDGYFNPEPTDQAVTRLRLREHANLNRRLGRDASQQMFVLQELERLSSKVFTGRIKPVASLFPRSRVRVPVRRALVCVLSDLHFGSDLHAEETGFLDYGRVEEARRLALVVKQLCEYKIEYRAETELRLIIAGDIIHGKLHDQQDGAPMAEQMVRAIHLLSQAVAQCAAAFPAGVKVHCVTGNHGRMLTRHPGRATTGKHDSNETVIYSSVKYATKHLKNVEFSIPTKPYDTFDLFGKRYFVTHGDTVLSAGNPGKSVQTERLETQINRWNASLNGQDEYSVFILGHVHTPIVHHLANGAWLVINGCLLPADNYCVSLGLPETVSDQVIFETIEGFPVGDFRFVTLDRAADVDATLDSVIKPWEGFDH